MTNPETKHPPELAETEDIREAGSEQQSLEAENSPELAESNLRESEALLEAAGAEADKLGEEIETSGLPERIKTSFNERLKVTTRKLLKFAEIAALLGSAALYGNYKATQYEVRHQQGPEGRAEYLHSDPETTHAINVITGKEKLKPSEQIEVLRNELKIMVKHKDMYGLEDHPLPDPDIIGKMDAEGLVGLSKQIYNKDDGDLPTDKYLDKHVNPGPEEFDPELHDAIWKLEEENGSPRVRFTYDYDAAEEYEEENFIDTKREQYSGLRNTIYLPINSLSSIESGPLDEYPHSRLRKDRPVLTGVKYIKDLFKSAYHAVKDWKTPREAYDDVIYNDESSHEYEAHEVIEPQLRDRLEKLTPVRTEKRRAEDEAYKQRVAEIDKQKIEALEKLNNEQFNEIYQAQYKFQHAAGRERNPIKLRNLEIDFQDAKSDINKKYEKLRDEVSSKYSDKLSEIESS